MFIIILVGGQKKEHPSKTGGFEKRLFTDVSFLLSYLDLHARADPTSGRHPYKIPTNQSSLSTSRALTFSFVSKKNKSNHRQTNKSMKYPARSTY